MSKIKHDRAVNTSWRLVIIDMYFKINYVIIIKFLGLAIWCYRCTSATPGCGENFNWKGIGYLGDACPEDDDFCVKITERKGGKN